jgi:biopolymer transport protein ExbB/TolQ
MFRLGSVVAAAVLAAVLIQPAFAETTAKDVSKQTGEAVDTLKSYSVDKKNEAMAYGKKMLNAADRDIKKLDRAAAKASDDTKAQWKEEKKGLKADRDALAKKLDEMGKASGDAWDGTKTAFADAYKDLRDGVSKASKKLK